MNEVIDELVKDTGFDLEDNFTDAPFGNELKRQSKYTFTLKRLDLSQNKHPSIISNFGDALAQLGY